MAEKLESRRPKKGEGVPKETRERSIVSDLASALHAAFPEIKEPAFIKAVEDAGYYEANMQRQVAILAEQALGAGGKRSAKKLFNAMLDSPKEKVHAVAVNLVMIAFDDNPDAGLPLIKRAASLPGMWPREMANYALHMLVIRHGFDTIFEKVRGWLSDGDECVRRVVAEGLRSRGVMIAHINELRQNPELLLPVLQPLLDDPSLYVRNAVANSLNDISKDNPDLAVKWATQWNGAAISEERRYILKRALRTLVSAGHPGALKLMGFGTADEITARNVSAIPPKVQINALLPFQVEIANAGGSEVVCSVMMLLDMPGKGASRRSKKYQLWKGAVAASATRTAGKKIHFVHNNSQPKEPGAYRYSFTVNGKKIEGGEFEL